MAKPLLSQSWVDRVTSERDDDAFVVGADLAPPPTAESIQRSIARATNADALREMARRKWFDPAPDVQGRESRVAGFMSYLFGEGRYRPSFASAALFKRHVGQVSASADIAALAWLYRVAELASDMKVSAFDRTKFDARAIRHLVQLSVRDTGPADGIAYLKKHGIRVVVGEGSLPGMKTDGASFLVESSQPVIALTLRHDRVDNFWFTLLHELGHVLLHLASGKYQAFVDSFEDDSEMDSEVEAEANAFAKDSFIPRDLWLRSEAFRLGKESAIAALARELNIHPAIVAGRVRFERKEFLHHQEHIEGGIRASLLAG